MVLVGTILLWVLQIYWLIMLARVLMTWLPNLDYSNPIVRFLYQATEPVLKPVRDALPPMQGFDFSAIVVFVGIFILRMVVASIFF
jgi:YggT family protein